MVTKMVEINYDDDYDDQDSISVNTVGTTYPCWSLLLLFVKVNYCFEFIYFLNLFKFVKIL